jgi:hypothetical protein
MLFFVVTANAILCVPPFVKNRVSMICLGYYRYTRLGKHRAADRYGSAFIRDKNDVGGHDPVHGCGHFSRRDGLFRPRYVEGKLFARVGYECQLQAVFFVHCFTSYDLFSRFRD